jgi:hypothetical protein
MDAREAEKGKCKRKAISLNEKIEIVRAVGRGETHSCGIIKSLKVRYRTALVKRLVAHVDANKPAEDFQFSILDCARVVARLWEELDAFIIRNCFAKAGFKVPQSDQEDVEPVGERNVFVFLEALLESKFEGVVAQDYVDADSDVVTERELTDEEIVQSVNIRKDVVRTEDGSSSDSEIEVESAEVTFSEAYEVSESVLHYSWRTSSCNSTGRCTTRSAFRTHQAEEGYGLFSTSLSSSFVFIVVTAAMPGESAADEEWPFACRATCTGLLGLQLAISWCSFLQSLQTPRTRFLR